MYITNNIHYPIRRNNYTNLQQEKKQNLPEAINNLSVQNPIKYSQIAFGAIYNVKVKKIDIDAEKSKLLKQIAEMLDVTVEDTDIEDIITNAIRKALAAFRSKIKQQTEILRQIEELTEDKTLSPQQKYERVNQLRKKVRQIGRPQKSTSKPKTKQKTPDERIDYQLLNRFKTAINEDNFNLKKVMQTYYGDLNEISTVEELNKKFPKIKTPKRPEEVIAEKIESTLTRDFYEQMDELYEQGSEQNLQKFIINKIADLCNGLKLKYVDAESFCKKILDPTIQLICQKYVIAKMSKGFSSIPENRKIKTPQISDLDMKLLSVNFDDFVLSIVRKHYLESQRLSDIKYELGDTKISMGELNASDYKFEKIPEKTKAIVTASDRLFTAQRDYNSYDMNQFRARLNYYVGSPLGNNEEILKYIIDFDASSFTDEDIQLLSKFLRELDSIHDGDKTIEEGINAIYTQDLRPKGTEKLNELERQKAAETIKLEQQKAFKLNELKNNFDNAINILYINNMNNIANTCSKYRPNSLDQKEIDNAKYIIETITKSINSDNEHSINKFKLEASISRWDIFNYYRNNDPNNIIFKRALSIAAEDNGSINVDKAGQYIMNSEIVDSYPESLEFVREPEILTRIMERTAGNAEAAIRYLSKFDDYKTLSGNDKTYLSTFMSMFDVKDPVDKILLKHIIENDYIKTDTKVLTSIHDTSDETIPATIGSAAKQQIYDKYKYPGCLQYLEAFEDALSSLASATGTSGIKKTGTNNKAIQFKMELKIKGHDDRLFSSKNDYYFDIFSDKGMH